MNKMENEPTSVEELFYKLKDYGETSLNLLKLKAINKVLGFSSILITSVFSIVFIFLILIFVSIGLALLVGEWLGHAYWGFFIMGLLYLIIWFILFLGKKKFFDQPVRDKLIKELID
jgi:energy-coupling factor transporter transmembrane protein EcfT